MAKIYGFLLVFTLLFGCNKSDNSASGTTGTPSGKKYDYEKIYGVIKTVHGTIKYKFYPKDAPNTVKRIVQLIDSGFYNGLIFHRVVPNFVIQGGDPTGRGTGGSGQKLKAEFNSHKHTFGTVAMARAADPNSADSQFYISMNKFPHLDGKYTVFGMVVEGIDVVRKVQKGDKMLQVFIEKMPEPK